MGVRSGRDGTPWRLRTRGRPGGPCCSAPRERGGAGGEGAARRVRKGKVLMPTPAPAGLSLLPTRTSRTARNGSSRMCLSNSSVRRGNKFSLEMYLNRKEEKNPAVEADPMIRTQERVEVEGSRDSVGAVSRRKPSRGILIRNERVCYFSRVERGGVVAQFARPPGSQRPAEAGDGVAGVAYVVLRAIRRQGRAELALARRG